MEEAVATRDEASQRIRRGLPLWPLFVLLCLCVLGTGSYLLSKDAPPKKTDSVITVKPSATLLVAIRDVARLETTELHMEKVIDLTDQQSRFFGLIEGTDALLLVATGEVRVGVDLGKMQDDDVSMDPTTKVATLRLPAPEVLSVSLDEKKTYVYRRSTSILAERNEHLETKARQEAVESIEKAARQSDVLDRSKQQAERQLRALAMGLGASDVKFVWR